MTYAMIEVSHPDDASRSRRVRALVDTGSTDCEVRGETVAALGLPETGEVAAFETAIGRVAEQPVYLSRRGIPRRAPRHDSVNYGLPLDTRRGTWPYRSSSLTRAEGAARRGTTTQKRRLDARRGVSYLLDAR